MKNKKGIEPVIATVLLIVITIVVVALVIAFVVPFVQEQMKGAELCYGARVEIKEACFNYTDSHLVIRIGRGAEDFELVGIVVQASVAEVTKTHILKEDTDYGDGLPKVLEEIQYKIPLTAFDIADNINITSVAISPVVKSGVTEKTCEITSQMTISICPE
ncbi:MAG: hypothetical protein IB618_01690 [Candidatus Pacearchaeota archaeon]|nr:MAG: hypothetical protein IB618_01690 [Candidatus Pacearchaeota archaeon]